MLTLLKRNSLGVFFYTLLRVARSGGRPGNSKVFLNPCYWFESQSVAFS